MQVQTTEMHVGIGTVLQALWWPRGSHRPSCGSVGSQREEVCPLMRARMPTKLTVLASSARRTLAQGPCAGVCSSTSLPVTPSLGLPRSPSCLRIWYRGTGKLPNDNPWGHGEESCVHLFGALTNHVLDVLVVRRRHVDRCADAGLEQRCKARSWPASLHHVSM